MIDTEGAIFLFLTLCLCLLSHLFETLMQFSNVKAVNIFVVRTERIIIIEKLAKIDWTNQYYK